MVYWSAGCRERCRGWAVRLGRVGIADGLWLKDVGVFEGITDRLWPKVDADIGVFEGIVWGADNDCTMKATCTVRKP